MTRTSTPCEKYTKGVQKNLSVEGECGCATVSNKCDSDEPPGSRLADVVGAPII